MIGYDTQNAVNLLQKMIHERGQAARDIFADCHFKIPRAIETARQEIEPKDIVYPGII
ncbi:MAG: hypothetical protein Q8P78_00415 [bacterium]|nr:hypothetical protein [bacterium]